MDPTKVPSDQFDRVMAELGKLNNQVDEIEHAVGLARGIDQYEARQDLEHARVRIKEAGFWIGQARRIAEARVPMPTPPMPTPIKPIK